MTTYHLLLSLHLLLAVFAVGPLVHAATTAGRGVRTGNATAVASSSRVLRIYSYVSAAVVAVGIPLMKLKPYGDELGSIGQAWIWLSIVLWVLAVGVTLGAIVPTLDRAGAQIAAEQSVVTLTGRVAALGGVVGLLYAAIVVLMVFQPGR